MLDSIWVDCDKKEMEMNDQSQIKDSQKRLTVIIFAKVIKIARLVMLSPLIWSQNIIIQHLFTYVAHEGRILKWYIPFGL